MAKYYGLIAGLPELSLEVAKPPISSAELREEMLTQLSSADRALLELVDLEHIHQSVLSLGAEDSTESPEEASEQLEQEPTEVDPVLGTHLGSLPRVYQAIASAERLPKHQLPTYILQYLQERFAPKAEESEDQEQAPAHQLGAEDRLAQLYYAYVRGKGKGFLSRWFALNQTLRNVMVVHTCKALGWDATAYVVGQTHVEQQLLTSKAPDYDLSDDVPEIGRMVQIAEEADITKRERMIDALKWEWLEEECFGKVFDIDSLLAYYLRLQILERWTRLNAEAGEATFRQIVHGLKAESNRSLQAFKQSTERK